VNPPELLVEVLPGAADVALDGLALGRGSRTVAAPPVGVHVVSVSAAGYAPERRELPPGDLGGVRVAVVLRPEGFGSGRALDYDEAEGLSFAAAFLVRSGDAHDAAEYAERAIAVDPGAALAHRARGDALDRMGDRRNAVGEWSEYLRLRPGAPDAAAVSERIARVRGDVLVPAER
jgi:tetratricopeptide (TPR) repeat protein